MSTAFELPDTLEVAYRTVLSKLIKSWLPDKLKDISDEYWLKELASVSTRKSVVEVSTRVALNMITRVSAVNFSNWNKAAIKTQRSSIIYDLLSQELSGRLGVRVNELVQQNAQYIAEIPADVSKQLSIEIAEASRQGTRPDAIAKILKFRFPQVMNSRIAMLARTQTSSASTALTRARSEELDIPCFQWWNSRDRRVRPSHRHMQAVVVFWKDLPSPESLIGMPPLLGHYAAGDCPNCRCNSLPILSTEDVFDKTGLVRVYSEGRIQMLTKTQFTRLSGIESRMAA
jgi:SPP1 gp7 family putative phage head morphogenesis protein